MSKLLGYKDIIRNMVWSYLYNYAHEKAEEWPCVEEDIILERNDDMYIKYEAVIKVDCWPFHVHGFVDEWGSVNVASIRYDIIRCTEKDERGNWIDESAVNVHVLLYNKEDLKRFNFNTSYDKKAVRAIVTTEKVRRDEIA